MIFYQQISIRTDRDLMTFPLWPLATSQSASLHFRVAGPELNVFLLLSFASSSICVFIDRLRGEESGRSIVSLLVLVVIEFSSTTSESLVHGGGGWLMAHQLFVRLAS